MKEKLEFTQLKIKAAHRKSIQDLCNLININRSSFYEAGAALAINKKILFETLRQLYPELEDYEFSVDHGNMESISIFGKILE